MKKKIHGNRKDLAGEHKKGDAGQLIIAVIFLIVWITDSFIFKYSIFLNEIIPNIIRTSAGILVLIAAGYLSRTGHKILFNEVREKPEVIRKSVFGIIRHPIYLSEILSYLGLLLISVSIASAVILIIAIVFLHYISRYEEKILLDFFGDEYRAYMKEVPMWLPKVSSLFKRKKVKTSLNSEK